MEALTIIGAILGYVLMMYLVIEATENRENKTVKGIILMVLWLVFTFMYAYGSYKMGQKEAVDNNPYKKEYLYKQMPDGEFQKYDSIYVKTKS